MIKDEFKFIRHNKLIMLSVIVIMFIPFLYAIFFLKSVWDPYGDTKSLPVAVVNNDVPVDYQGKTLDVGAQTVKKLKHNDQLGWHFVSTAQAKDGLKHDKYYTVVTIPKNFSKNAATVLEAHPHKMHLKYTTNDSLNYLSQVISGIGVDKLDKQIRANVTNAYASAVFDQIKTVGKGFSKAAGGATQLSDGTATLDDGVSQYTVGVSAVNKGVQTLKVSVKPLTSGVQQLADGGNQLKAGVGPLTSGVQQLANGGNQLQQGVRPLTSGVQQLAAGGQQLQQGVRPLADGANQLQTGASNLQTGVKAYTDGTSSLVEGVKKLQTANEKGDPDTNTPAITDSIKQLAAGSKSLNQGAGAYVAGVNQSFNTIRGGITQIQAGVKTNTDNAAKTSKQITSDMTQLTLLAKLKYGKDAQLNHAVDDLTAQLKTLSAQQATSTATLNAGLQQMASGLSTANPQYNQLAQGAKQLIAGAQTLADGTAALNTGYQTFSAGIDTAVAGGDTLLANNQPLNSGAAALNSGITQLSSQVPALTGGVNQLANGLNALNSKTPALASGVNQLAGGLNTLNGKTPALASGVNQLAGGLNTLNSQTPALASGVNQLADGTGQLADKSKQLTDGTGQLKDGSKTLATSLTAGAKQVNGIKLTNETAKMFAAPTHTTQKHYSYVSNYGHALAPYVLSLALYVGAIVFNFAYPIRKVSHKDGTATQWFTSKIVLGGLVAVGMAVIEASLIILGGLTVDHLGLFYAVAIVFSLTSMYFVMMLSMAFDNPGRFVAMIMLMLQLGGAGGTFPLEITNGFYNAIHPFLPMSYSVLGFRQAITGGIYSGTVANCFGFLVGFAMLSLLLLWVAMQILQKHHLMGVSQLDDNQKLQEVEK